MDFGYFRRRRNNVLSFGQRYVEMSGAYPADGRGINQADNGKRSATDIDLIPRAKPPPFSPGYLRHGQRRVTLGQHPAFGNRAAQQGRPSPVIRT